MISASVYSLEDEFEKIIEGSSALNNIAGKVPQSVKNSDHDTSYDDVRHQTNKSVDPVLYPHNSSIEIKIHGLQRNLSRINLNKHKVVGEESM